MKNQNQPSKLHLLTVHLQFARVSFVTLFYCSLIQSLLCSEWTRFRGPNGSGHSPAQGIPLKWSKENYSWIIELPGVGHSSPVIWEKKLFTTCADEKNGEQYVQCADVKSGQVIWEKKFQSEHYLHHKFNSFASATPCVDKDFLIVSWTTKNSNVLLCLEHDGSLKWKRDFGAFLTQHGNGFSPILYEEKVIVTHDHQGESALLALDRKTGKTLWQTNRISSKPSSSTPLIYTPANGSTQVISNSMSHGCYAVDIENGNVLWETGLGSLDKRTVSSPVQSGDFFFATCGSGTRGSRLIAVQPSSSPTKLVTTAYTLTRNVPYVPTPLAVDQLIFLLTDGGIASCIERDTGKIFWRERLEGNFFASPIIINDIVLIVSTMGEISTLRIDDKKITVLGKSQLDELTHNTPAVGANSLFFRTYSKLFCLPFSEL